MILIEKLQCNKGENRAEFENKVRNISNLLRINPSWLMMVMYNESRLNAQVVNMQPGDNTDPYIRCTYRAVGLIQFMPLTSLRLGTTNRNIYNMRNIDQLDYVYKYFLPFAGKVKSYFDLYFITFFPDAIGKPDEWVMQTDTITAAKIAQQNPGLDLNKDGKITVGEFKRKIYMSIPTSIVAEVVSEVEKKSLNWGL